MVRSLRTCDSMTEIDGIALDEPAFALTVSNALTPDMVADRLRSISERAETCPHLRFVCVRDDAMDGGFLTSAASMASECGLGLIVRSDIPENIGAAVSSLDGRRPLVTVPDRTPTDLVDIAGRMDLPIAVCDMDPENIMALCEMAEAGGCRDIVLGPPTVSMKQCLESTVRVGRLSKGARPMMASAWSGEYALTIASVSVLRGGRLVVLDDLDAESCGVLDSLMERHGGRYTF